MIVICLTGAGQALNQREIGKFSTRDAEAYPKYEKMLERVAAVIEPTIDAAAAECRAARRVGPVEAVSTGSQVPGLGVKMAEAIEILTGAARPMLDRWFESEQLKATLATDAIIGAFAAPSQPGTAYVLFHHVMGETNGKKGVWSYMRGGMGGLTQALAKAGKGPGRRDSHRGGGREHPGAKQRGGGRGAERTAISSRQPARCQQPDCRWTFKIARSENFAAGVRGSHSEH